MSPGAPGGLFVRGASASPVLERCVLKNNVGGAGAHGVPGFLGHAAASGAAGAVEVWDGATVELLDGRIEGNTGGGGGARAS